MHTGKIRFVGKSRGHRESGDWMDTTEQTESFGITDQAEDTYSRQKITSLAKFPY
jgi:hypothetical protein